MLRSNDRTARLAGKINTTIQQKPLDQLTRVEGEGASTNIYDDSINGHLPFLREAKILLKKRTRHTENLPHTTFRINTSRSGAIPRGP